MASVVVLAVMAVVARGWLSRIGCAIPDAAAAGRDNWGADARLIIWVLTWTVQALATAPSKLFDPPVCFPSPGALTGSELFLSSQLFFAPSYLLTHNPALAASTATLLSYVLGGLSMLGLLRRFRFSWTAAIAGAMTNMLGPLQVPADLHVLQYPSWCLPTVAWSAERLAERPSGRRGVLFTLALVAAFLASYQIVMNTVVLLVLLGALWVPRACEPWRLVRALGASVALASLVLAAVSLPHLLRLGEPRFAAAVSWEVWDWVSGFSRLQIVHELALPTLLVAGLGWIGRGVLPADERRACALGTAMSLAGLALSLGWTARIARMRIPLPFALVALTPIAQVAAPWRFLVLAGSGVAVLTACGVSVTHRLVSRRTPSGARWCAVAACVIALVGVAEPIARFGPPPLTCLPTADRLPPVYGWLATASPGPLLEWPGPDAPFSGRRMMLQAEAMYVALYHHRPILNLHTNHVPAACDLLRPLIGALPDPDSLQAVVDMTGVRWILVRTDGPLAMDASRWLASPGAGLRLAGTFDGDLLFRVELTPKRPWEAALARRPRRDTTLLGTALAPLAHPAARLEVAPPPASVVTGGSLDAHLTITNAGQEPWPVAVPPRASDALVVRLEVRWEGPQPFASTVWLPYDVGPGDSIHLASPIPVPPAAGEYEMRWLLSQPGGSGSIELARHRVLVETR